MNYPDDDYDPEGHQFDQLIDYTAKLAQIGLTLLAIAAAVALIIAGISAWRYVADCTAHPQLGVGECAGAWGYRLLPG